MYLTVLKQLLIMLVISMLAFAFSKKNRFGSSESAFLSRLLLYFVNPCLIFNSFDQPFALQKLRELAFVIALSLLLHLVMTAVVSLCIRSKGAEGKSLDGLEKVGIVFTNSGFIGIPLINGVFGPEGVFYLTGYLAVFNVYLWTYGEYQMSHRFSVRKVLTNPNVLAVLCGIVLFCLPVRLPEIIAKPLSYISEMNTALSMFLLGLLFASFKKEGNTSYARRIVKVSLLRLERLARRPDLVDRRHVSVRQLVHVMQRGDKPLKGVRSQDEVEQGTVARLVVRRYAIAKHLPRGRQPLGRGGNLLRKGLLVGFRQPEPIVGVIQGFSDLGDLQGQLPVGSPRLVQRGGRLHGFLCEREARDSPDAKRNRQGCGDDGSSTHRHILTSVSNVCPPYTRSDFVLVEML